MKNKYDVIIIGAGIGGLTAAAILARNGKKVLVLEKNPVAGGYAVNFKRRGFIFDASLHMINGCGEGGGLMYNILKRSGVLQKISLIKPKYLYRSIYPDIDITVPQCNIPEYIDILSQHFPKEIRGINKLFIEMRGLHHDAECFSYSKISFNIERLYFALKYRYLFKYSNKTFEYLLDKYLNDQRLKGIISQLWLYFGLPSSKLASFYYVYPTIDYLHNGGYYLKGGSQSLTNALLEVIIENGGKILYRVNANRLIIKNKLAIGIETDKGQFIADSFISNIDARTTFLRLISQENLSVKFIRNLMNMQPSISAFQLYLGLDKSPEKLGLSEYEIWLNPSYDIDKQFEASLGRVDVKKALLVLAMYSTIDSSMTMPGKSVMSIGVLSDYDYWASLSKERYLEEKQKVSQELIEQAEKIIPNLSSCIAYMESATPLTMERYTGNYKGALYGWSQIISQSGINRQRKETPIRNLYLASGWTRIGGGILAVAYAGESAADAILK